MLLRWPSAVAVGQGVGRPGQVVFDPFGIGGERVGIETEEPAVDVDAGLAIPFELGSQRGVMQVGIQGGHGRAGMAEEALDHMLGDTLVDESCPERVA